MPQESSSGREVAVLVQSEAALAALASMLAADRQPGDVYLLHGPVGAGKSAFRCGVASVAGRLCFGPRRAVCAAPPLCQAPHSLRPPLP